MIRDFPRRLVTNHHTRPVALRLRRPTSARRMLPSFVIIGAQKAGTTSLYEYLSRHEGVAPAVVKETRHFDLTPAASEADYRAFFPLRSRHEARITGEATPEYLLFPWVPGALAEMVPRARIIVILRDPVERAFSHYRHSVSRGEEHLSFEAALAAESERLANGPQAPGTAAAMRYSRFSYATRGRYAEQLQRWYDAFPRDQVLVLSFRELAERPQDTVDRVTEFLGLAAFSLTGRKRYNVGEVASMSPEARAWLASHFETPDRDLTELLGAAPYWADQSA